MGSLKLEQSRKVEYDQERGKEVQENVETKLEEAEASNAAMEQIEAIDDDDKASLDQAVTESAEIAKNTVESEIREPGTEIGESLKETSEQSQEYSETEKKDAEKATEMTGDYSETGSELAENLQESGQEFQEIAEAGDQTKSELDAEYDRLAAALEGVF